MSYNPHKYKSLFKKGLFGYANEELKNWAESQRLFALNQEPLPFETTKLAEGLVLKRGHLKIGNGFSNYVIFEVETKLRKIETHYSPKSSYPIDVFRRNRRALALLNLGYYYLTTHEEKDKIAPPRIRVGNLAVYKSQIVNLPIVDRSAFICFKGNKVKLSLVKARGVVAINGKEYNWVGSGTKHKGEVIVYNSSNINITNVNDPIIGPFRTPNKTYVVPGLGKKLITFSNNRGRFKAIRGHHGNVVVNEHDLVLEIPRSLKVKKGSVAKFLSIGNYLFEDIAYAVSIGPRLRSKEKQRIRQVRLESLDKDPFLSNSPHRENLYLARGCLVDLGGGKLATVSVDGIPQAGEIYPGVTPSQLADFIWKTYPEHKIAVCTDPSNTVKVIYKKGRKTHVFGNTHYLAYKRLRGGLLKFWPNGVKGRKIHTMLVIK